MAFRRSSVRSRSAGPHFDGTLEHDLGQFEICAPQHTGNGESIILLLNLDGKDLVNFVAMPPQREYNITMCREYRKHLQNMNFQRECNVCTMPPGTAILGSNPRSPASFFTSL